MKNSLKQFLLTDQVFVITGGAGLLGIKHAEAILELGAKVALLDIDGESLDHARSKLEATWSGSVIPFVCDITNRETIEKVCKTISKEVGVITGLINNAANNPAVSRQGGKNLTRLENFSAEQWQKDIDVGLTGAFLCSQVFGGKMARENGGVILNIASDLSVIAPDQRIYQQVDLSDEEQPVKPVTYSVVKTALIGLTRYLATYWATKNVRVNSLSPGGVYQDQSDDFVTKLTGLIPMQRMAEEDEYQGAIQFLCSGASRYMTGQNVIMDGGRSVW